MANVAFINPALSNLWAEYLIIRDCLAGEITIKKKGKLYLPKPNPNDDSDDADEKYKNYLKRAVFFNVARNTLLGLLGQVFATDPVVNLNTSFDFIVKNATGAGVSLNQIAKQLCMNVVGYGRGGIFVDYPDTSETNGASQSDIQTGKYRPTLTVYSPLEIINWRVIDDGANEKLSLVVLFESYGYNDDGFEIKTACQFRVLQLVNGVYVQSIYRENSPSDFDGTVPKGKNFQLTSSFIPTDATGKTFDHIPFHFAGSQNNDANPDAPNFYDICSLNIAHYRNSADYEDSCFICGQPTPVVTGLTEQWYNETLNKTLKMGSNGGIPLPVGATFDLKQAAPNTMIKEAMDSKERKMVALGAKLVQQQEVQRTATEATNETAKEISILQSCAANVGSAIENALLDAGIFGGYDTSNISYALNTDYDVNDLDPTTLLNVVKLWQLGAITFEEMRQQLRRGKIATADDDKAKADIAREAAEAMATVQATPDAGAPNKPQGKMPE